MTDDLGWTIATDAILVVAVLVTVTGGIALSVALYHTLKDGWRDRRAARAAARRVVRAPLSAARLAAAARAGSDRPHLSDLRPDLPRVGSPRVTPPPKDR